MRNLAERHLQEALTAAKAKNVIHAAADPSQFIPTSTAEDFGIFAYSAWLDAVALVNDLGGDLIEIPIFDELIRSAVQRSTNTYMDLLNKLIGDKAFKTLQVPDFGEFLSGNLVQYGDVRQVLADLGGGPVDAVSAVNGGILSGQITKDWLGQNGIATDQMIWLYGYEDEPRRTFNGHLQMDGLVFSEWDDPALEVSPQDDWLRTEHYFPGDHWGCACVVAPYIPNWGAPYQIETP